MPQFRPRTSYNRQPTQNNATQSPVNNGKRNANATRNASGQQQNTQAPSRQPAGNPVASYSGEPVGSFGNPPQQDLAYANNGSAFAPTPPLPDAHPTSEAIYDMPTPQESEYDRGYDYDSDEDSSEDEKVFAKIARVFGKERVIDFTSNLIRSNPEHFAMMHGTGGSGYAPNSTIRINLASFSGPHNNFKVKEHVYFNLNVRDVEKLYHAAKEARTSKFAAFRLAYHSVPLIDAVQAVLEELRQFFSTAREDNRGYFTIAKDLVVRIGTMLREAVESDVLYTYERMKTNPHGQKGGLSSVRTIKITYDLKRRYPWEIAISNMMAPTKDAANGTVQALLKQAQDKKNVAIWLSEDDFWDLMIKTVHFIEAWEHDQYRDLAYHCRQIDRAKREKNKEGN